MSTSIRPYYEITALLKAVSATGQNLDQFLTRKIAEGLLFKRLKTPMIFFYTPFQHQIMITGCMKGQKARFDWLMALPGYTESGQNFVPDHAGPLLLWDGEKVFRILEKPDDYRPGDYLFCDFGSLAGLQTDTAPADTYLRIRDNPGDNPFLSTVPENCSWRIESKGETYSIEYTFFEAVRHASPARFPGMGPLLDQSQNQPDTVSTPAPPNKPPQNRSVAWADIMESCEGGFFQQCSSCDWIGVELRSLLDRCPACGSLTHPYLAYQSGGLQVWMTGSGLRLCPRGEPSFGMKVEAADLPDVINLLDHWNAHPSKY